MTRFWPLVVNVSAKPIVQGFLGALLAVCLMLGAWKVYGVVRWKVYGRNAERISTLEQKANQADVNIQNIIRYLQQQEAAKAAGAK